MKQKLQSIFKTTVNKVIHIPVTFSQLNLDSNEGDYGLYEIRKKFSLQNMGDLTGILIQLP